MRVISLTPPDYYYFFPCDAVEHTADESMGVYTALWHMIQQTVERDGHSILDLQVCCNVPHAYDI